MAEQQALTTTASASAPAAPLAGRLAAISHFARQPAIVRALPLLAGMSAISVAALAYMAFQSGPQAPLFAGLADADKAAIAESLNAAGLSYTIDPATGTLSVDAAKVHEARMLLAGQGLPKAAPSGNAMIMAMPMGASRAVEGDTLRSAREADLARSIEAIDAVAVAKVHIATPEPSPFVRDSKPAKASVMLTLRAGRTLSEGQVQAIRFLVASSVPGMNAEQVSVIDQRGVLLSSTASSTDLTMFQLQMKIEDRLRAAVDALFGPMLGAGNYSVEVHADVDMTESQATRETYPENDRAIRQEQMVKSVSGQVSPTAAGIPGALSNQPPPATELTTTPPEPGTAAVETEQQSNENVSRAYEVGREIAVTHQPQGRIRRISVAVALNQGAKPFTREDLAKFDALVKGAVGFEAERGDVVAIDQRPFSKVEQVEPPVWEHPWFMPILQQAGALLAAVLAFFFIGRPLIRQAKQRAAARLEHQAVLEESLMRVSTTGAGTGERLGSSAITLEMIEAAPSYDARAKLVRAFVRQNPERAAMVVRQLIQEDKRA